MYCYASQDKNLRDELDKHFVPLKRAGRFIDWYDGKISPGQEREQEIKKQLTTAHIILLLISPDFMASNDCYDKEMKKLKSPTRWQRVLGIEDDSFQMKRPEKPLADLSYGRNYAYSLQQPQRVPVAPGFFDLPIGDAVNIYPCNDALLASSRDTH
jgi:hypothetical protein